jgi:phage FluMu protein Com
LKESEALLKESEALLKESEALLKEKKSPKCKKVESLKITNNKKWKISK